MLAAVTAKPELQGKVERRGLRGFQEKTQVHQLVMECLEEMAVQVATEAQVVLAEMEVRGAAGLEV